MTARELLVDVFGREHQLHTVTNYDKISRLMVCSCGATKQLVGRITNPAALRALTYIPTTLIC